MVSEGQKVTKKKKKAHREVINFNWPQWVRNGKFKLFHKIWSHQHNFLYGILIQIKGGKKQRKKQITKIMYGFGILNTIYITKYE